MRHNAPLHTEVTNSVTFAKIYCCEIQQLKSCKESEGRPTLPQIQHISQYRTHKTNRCNYYVAEQLKIRVTSRKTLLTMACSLCTLVGGKLKSMWLPAPW